MSHRTLAFAIGVATALSAQMAAALGLGEIRLNSTLNQPLDAEIQLLQVRDLSEQEILVGLASNEDFRRIGVERPYFLADLKFSINLDSPNGPVIEITSDKPVREPFLNFLVQAQWPSGRLMREYTLLLDLPVYDDEQQAQPVQAAPQQNRDSGRTASNNAPRQSQQQQPERQAQPEPDQSARPDSRTQTGSTYGPVKASDTLWDIAAEARGDSGVSVQQAMIAIHRANPGAFINNNINLLRQGQVLRIPNSNEMAELTARDAIAEVAVHNQRWSSGIEGPAERAQLEGSQSYARNEQQASAPEGRVKLSSPQEYSNSAEGRSTGGSEGSTEALETELATTLEELDKTRSENDELRSRLEALEAQIETMERLVDVSNEEMRALQLASQNARQQNDSAAQDDPSQTEQPDSASQEPAEVAESDATEQTGTASDEVAIETGSPELEATDGALSIDDAAGMADGGRTVEGGPAVDDLDVSAADGQQVAIEEAETARADSESAAAPGRSEDQAEASGPQQAIDPTKVVRTAPRPEKGLLDHVMDNSLLIGLALIALLAAIAVFLRARRSANSEDDFNEFAMGSDDEWQETEAQTDYQDEDDSTAFVGTGLQHEDEAGDEREHAEQETEDPVAEADIYIALAKYEQAEEILQPALDKDPQNGEIRLKLLELYAAQQDIDKFDAQFAEVQTIGDADMIERGEELRAKIIDAPEFDQSRYATGAVTAATAAAVIESDDENQDDDLSLDLSYDDLEFDASAELDSEAGKLDSEINSSLDEVTADDFEGLDFDLDTELDQIATDAEQPGTVDEAAVGDDDDLSFDFELDVEDEIAGANVESEESDTETLELDDEFAFDLGSDEVADEEDTDASADSEFGDIEFNLDGVEPEGGAEQSGLADEEATDPNDELKADMAYSGSASEESKDDEFDFGDFQLEDEPAQVASAAAEEDDEWQRPASNSVEDEDDLELADELDLSALDQELDAMTSDFDMELDDELDTGDSAAHSTAGVKAEEPPAEQEKSSDLAFDELETDEPAELKADEDLASATSSPLNLEDELADLDTLDADLRTEQVTETEPAEESEAGDAPDWLDLDEPIETEQESSTDEVAAVQTDPHATAEEAAAMDGSEDEELPDYEALMGAADEFDLSDLDDGEDDGDLGFLSDSDETATKLDLARAYMDMGDADGARDILEEILQEGNDDQRKEAQELMERV